jgi:hypothetical protein
MNTNNLFLMGAGFDRALFGPDIPLNSEVIGRLKKTFDYAPWTAHLEKYPTDDIERSLTYLDLEVKSPRANSPMNDHLSLRWFIEQEIARYFSDFQMSSSILNQEWTKFFAAKVLGTNDVIVNLNYTCLLEGLLDASRVWTPHGGYSQFIDNGVLGVSSGSIPKNETIKNIIVYKIHGSTHFHLSNVAGKPQETIISFKINESLFPVSGRNINFGPGVPDRGRYVIAPSFIKFWHIQVGGMMVEALKRITSAQNLVILGCGMRLEDNFLFLMLTNFLHTGPPGGKIIVIDPNPDQVIKNIRDYSSWIWDGVEKQLVIIKRGIDLQGMQELEEKLTSRFSRRAPEAL